MVQIIEAKWHKDSAPNATLKLDSDELSCIRLTLSCIRLTLSRRVTGDDSLKIVNLTPNGIPDLNTTWDLPHKVFDTITSTFEKESNKLRIQLHLKEGSWRGDAEFCLGLESEESEDPVEISQDCLEVDSAAEQIDHDEPEASTSEANEAPVRPSDIFEHLHSPQRRSEASSSSSLSSQHRGSFKFDESSDGTHLLGKRVRESTIDATSRDSKIPCVLQQTASEQTVELGVGDLDADVNLGTSRYLHDVAGYDAEAKADELQRDGFTILPVPWMTLNHLKNVQSELHQEMQNFPEFKPEAEESVMGGFSALGNPASFHNLPVRRLRENAMMEAVPLFKAVLGRLEKPGRKLEQLVDRLMFRRAGVGLSSESWHRDEVPGAAEEDHIFGGWWNLSVHDQTFPCIPGSHKDVTEHAGFKPIRDKDDLKELSAQSRLVQIPAGSILIFHEHILQAQIARKESVDLYRLYLGWRLTFENVPLTSNLTSILEEQGVVPLKSGQTPPMYAKLHWTNWRTRLETFSAKNIIDECTQELHVRSGKGKGDSVRIVHRFMKSLKDYGLRMYPSYEPEELAILQPGTTWRVRRGPDATAERVLVKLSDQ